MHYLILIQEHMQLLHADPQVSFIEFIWDIPTQWSKFSPLLDKRVKETEAIQQLLELHLQEKTKAFGNSSL